MSDKDKKSYEFRGAGSLKTKDGSKKFGDPVSEEIIDKKQFASLLKKKEIVDVEAEKAAKKKKEAEMKKAADASKK